MGAAKGTLRPDQTNFRKKGTGNPVLIAKQEGKHLDSHIIASSISEMINWEQVKYLKRSQAKRSHSEVVFKDILFALYKVIGSSEITHSSD